MESKITEVLYNPYDGSQIAENAAKKPGDMPGFTGKKVIVSMGREDDCKDSASDQMPVSDPGKVPEAMLCIIGDGSFSEYKELAEKLGNC